jgi:hypothetical protein
MVLQQKTVKELFWKGRPVGELNAPELLEALEWCYERLTAYEGRLTSFCAAGDFFSDGSEDQGAPKPSVSKEFLEAIGFDEAQAALVLEGNFSALLGSFDWEKAGGCKHWERIWSGERDLCEIDKLMIRSWLDAANYYEKNNG